MVSFRKMSMAFAGCLLAAGIASAAAPVTCSLSAGSTSIKIEGLTELIGDLTVTCNQAAGAPLNAGGAYVATLQFQTDGAVFTNVRDDGTQNLTNPTITKAVGAGAPGALAKQAVLSPDGKSVSFSNIDVSELRVAQGGAADSVTFVISGLKINGSTAQGLLTTPKVKLSVVSNGEPNKPFVTDSTSVQPVGTVQQGATFGATKAASAANLNCSAYSGPADMTAANVKVLARVTFTPGFITALPVGTKLTARFTVPTNASLYVANNNFDFKSGSETWADNGAGVAVAAEPLAAIAGSLSNKFTQIKANSTTGIYEATWVVKAGGAGVTGLESYSFPVYIKIPQNFVPDASLTALGGIGPFSTVTTSTDDPDVPEPRFITPTASSAALVSYTSCTTTLLFPYVTNAGNWDTGIAISNPTADMQDDQGKWASGNSDNAKPGQDGTCTLYFVGDKAPAKAIKSSTVKAGETVAFMVSGGSEKYAIAGVPGINGYLKVACTFSGGKGFAFMSSPDLGGVGVGYVAADIDSLVP